MKWIKKLITTFLVLVLINLISILILSLNLKKILVDGIIKETITAQITKKDQKESNFIITEETLNQITDDERIKELLNTKEVNDLLNKYLDLTVDSIIDESKLNEIEIERDMMNFLEKNKSSLEDLVGTEITEEAIENTRIQMESGDWSRSYKQSIKNTSKSINKTEKTVLVGYKFFISVKFKVIIISLIALDIILIMVIEKSWIKLIKKIIDAVIISSISLILMSIVIQTLVRRLADFPSFQMASLLNTCIILLVTSILLRILYAIVLKKTKKEEENDLSKTFNSSV